MRKPITWVVVADGHRARVLKNEKGVALESALDVDFTAPNPLDHEIGPDRPGRTKDSTPNVRHALEPRVDHHRQRKAAFAHDLAHVIDEAAEQNRFARLILVAPPQALGDLRQHLGPHARERVRGELPLDLTHETVPDIQGRLAEASWL